MLNRPKTPFKCLRPLHIKNIYTGREMTVGCGTCKACLKKMADLSAYKCRLHGADHKYTMFVTLTYSNENVPTLRVTNCGTSAPVPVSYNDIEHEFKAYDLYDVTERFSKKRQDFNGYIARSFVHPFEISQLKHKFYYFDNEFPYLSKYDAQCFLKRFRKNLTKYSDEKITYYLVGEYGPVHFRPHFHVLFFFDDERTFQNFGKVLSKSWTLGNFDFSLSNGKCDNYVAKYVNSRNSVPRLYNNRALRPFCLHSSHFAERFYQSQKETIYEDVHSSFDALCRPLGNSVTPTYPWRSLVALFFPKCKGYDTKSYRQLSYAYTVAKKLRQFYKDDKITNVIECLYSDIYNYQLGARNSLPSSQCYLLQWFVNEFGSLYDNSKMLCELSSDDVKRVKVCMYRLIHTSVHFLTFVCDNNDNLIKKRLDQIIEYYSYQDYKCLCNNLELQEELDDVTSILHVFYDNVSIKHDDLGMSYIQLYDDVYPNLSSSDYQLFVQELVSSHPLYQSFLSYVNDSFNASIKHKHLNDLNDLFCSTNINN